MKRLLACSIAVLAACHVRDRVTRTTPGVERREVQREQVRALPPTVLVDTDGWMRFVAPLRCQVEVKVEVERSETVTTRPNLATFVVGVVATAAGAIALWTGIASDDPGGSPATWGGVVGIGGGLTFAIGPWIGNGEEDVARGVESVHKGVAEEPCGDRAVVARTASVRSGRFQVFGGVGDDGRFTVSPFTFVDAFAIGEEAALDVSVDLVRDGGIESFEAVVDAGQLAAARDGWLAAAGIDGRVEPLRKVPSIDLGAIRVEKVADGVKVVLPVKNDGPGDAWQVRGVISATDPEIDGRILYVGHLPRGHAVDASVTIPLSAGADAALRGKALELQIQLRDAHGAAPETPHRFRGRVP